MTRITRRKPGQVFRTCSMCDGVGSVGTRDIRGAIGREYQTAPNRCFACDGMGGTYVWSDRCPCHGAPWELCQGDDS